MTGLLSCLWMSCLLGQTLFIKSFNLQLILSFSQMAVSAVYCIRLSTLWLQFLYPHRRLVAWQWVLQCFQRLAFSCKYCGVLLNLVLVSLREMTAAAWELLVRSLCQAAAKVCIATSNANMTSLILCTLTCLPGLHVFIQWVITPPPPSF